MAPVDVEPSLPGSNDADGPVISSMKALHVADDPAMTRPRPSAIGMAPLLVREMEESKYEVVAGARRNWRNSKSFPSA
jgi:hypothetical protein